MAYNSSEPSSYETECGPEFQESVQVSGKHPVEETNRKAKGARVYKRSASERDGTKNKVLKLESGKEEEKEEEDLSVAARLSVASAEDSTDDETTEEDRKFMDKAKEVAKKSPDPQTKVGAVIVNPKTKKVVGTGWNRMPTGCEDQFLDKWVSEDENEPIEHGRHHYVVYGVRAAIFDALMKKEDLKGCILYVTLFPSNICAQCILDVGIAEVVYVSDKFHQAKFMDSAREILEGIKCRQID